MTNTLYIPVMDGSTSLNGVIAMFINSWSGNKTHLTLVNHPSDSWTIPIPTSLTAQGAKVNPDLTLLTTLPLLVVGESETFSRLTVSGLAAVSRHLMKESNDPVVVQSLGFRGNCLQAPAECSIWTSFCEVQMVQSTILFLTQQQKQDVVEIPTALVKLEEHMKQPIRMHNVVKRWQKDQQYPQSVGQLKIEEIQKMAGSLLHHSYVEGPDMTLADLLLFPCIILLADRLTELGVQLADHLPRVSAWLTTMKPAVSRAWSNTVGEKPFPNIGSLRIQPQPQVKIPRVKQVSLYKKDSVRRTGSMGNLSSEEIARVIDLLRRQRLMWLDDDDGARVTTELPEGLISHIDVAACSDFTAKIDWLSLPDPAHPQQGHVPGSRVDRKIQQLDGMATAVIDAVSQGDVVVDFCSGGGHLGIILAYFLPRCHVVMVDNKEESVRNARRRVAQLMLNNVTIIQSNLCYFRGRFDLGVALHACGVATDLVLHTCLAQRAAFVICPCCYGNLAHPDLPVQYPQSELYGSRAILTDDFSVLARMADHITPSGRLAMAAARGPKKHLKRLAAPKSWMLDKLGGVFAPRPSTGPHKLRESLPLVVFLRNRLKYALNNSEVTKIVMQRLIKVDGKVRTDSNYPAGFMDVITIDKTGEYFRLVYDVKGRFAIHRITAEEAKYKLCKVRRVQVGPKGIPFITTHDGRTIRYPDPLVKVNDTIQLDIATNKIMDFIKFDSGNLCMITGGRNLGRVGTIINRERHPGSFDIVHVKDALGHLFATRLNNVFIIGKGSKAYISLPRDKGVKLSIAEERNKRLAAKAAA
uniref:Small ribosomal subunit protein eS4 n=1 Tax=Daphnia similis TaxID=35528 RepID=A0A4Y7LRY0_9CRUS|nr:EOG090X0615 [Daphnia similis]SVE71675.1 EOG090X0615 [Daphnia similis]SVE72307.1 EOG090X0615 [Daphnia similis]